MSDDGVASILRRIDAMDREHRRQFSIMEMEREADMTALSARIDILTEAHRNCSRRCWVANDEQLRAALKASSTNLQAIKDET
jgi:hypothetical protein